MRTPPFHLVRSCLFLALVAISTVSDREAPNPRDGIYHFANGYQDETLELRHGRFRYWWGTDYAYGGDRPLEGRFSLKGAILTLHGPELLLGNERIFHWFRGLDALWRPYALKRWLGKGGLSEYGILFRWPNPPKVLPIEYVYLPPPIKAAMQADRHEYWKYLEESASTFGGACYQLGLGYQDGELGDEDPVTARECFAQGARLNSRFCWEELANCYRRGLGGPQDEAEAYYWISLAARCVDPKSSDGFKAWQIREEIAQHLSLPVLELAWQRTDLFVAQVAANEITVESSPFLDELTDPKIEGEGCRSAQTREDEHRKQLRARGAQPTTP